MSRRFVITLESILAVLLQSQTARSDTTPSTVFVNGKVLMVKLNYTFRF